METLNKLLQEMSQAAYAQDGGAEQPAQSEGRANTEDVEDVDFEEVK